MSSTPEDRLRELLEKTTPGKWMTDEYGAVIHFDHPEGKTSLGATFGPLMYDNSEFIVAAHNNLPAVLEILSGIRKLHGEMVTLHSKNSLLPGEQWMLKDLIDRIESALALPQKEVKKYGNSRS